MYRILFITVLFILLPSTLLFAQLDREPDTFEGNMGTITVHPIVHGSVIFEFNDLNIYVDPYGSADLYEGKGNPDLILITHPHGDHLNPETLSALNTENATFIVPEAVAKQMPDQYQGQLQILGNGSELEKMGISIKAVPMYNLPEEGARHAKGWGNGYVLTLGDKKVYVSGDTEDIPEMRELEDIDIAFVCMNLPYTMDINQASSAVLDFEPAIVYPYHHRGQDIQEFKKLVDAGNKIIEVRLKNWYPGS